MRPARQAIDRVEHLDRADQVELVDRRHDHHDDAAAGGGGTRRRGPGGGRHACRHYGVARRLAGKRNGARLADFDGSLSRMRGRGVR